MLFSAVFVLIVAQSSSEIPEGLMNNPVHTNARENITRTRSKRKGDYFFVAHSV